MKQSKHTYLSRAYEAIASVIVLCSLFAVAERHAKGQSPAAPGFMAASGTVERAESRDTTRPFRPAQPTNTKLTLNRRRFDLAKSEELNAFLQTVKDLRALSKDQKGESKAEQDDSEETTQPKNKRKGAKDWSSKKVRAGLKAMQHIAESLQQGKGESTAEIRDLQEIAWAVESNFLTPYVWRESVDLGDLLFRTRYMTLNASGRGSLNRPATNLSAYSALDLSKVDPIPSTFWSPPASIADKDLYTGFDRAAIPDYTDAIYTYDGPHKGYGIHPSFEVTWHDTQWKVKFDEEHSSAPFACRLFWALGYPVEIVDYTPQVKVRWDRRILSLFNSRKLVATQIKLVGIPIKKVHPNRYFDPFHYIAYAVLKDGSHVQAPRMRELLFPVKPGKSRPARPEEKPDLYDKEFEGKLDYVVMKDASFTPTDSENGQEIGFWDYNTLGHAGRRELRGMAVLDAWLDNWDVRWSNTRLFLAEDKSGGYRLKHVVTDLGALFGNSSGFVRMVHGKVKMNVYQNAPNDYTWTFTHPQAPEKMGVPIQNYMPVSKIGPFYDMNREDGRWMARLIGQFTEAQLKEALIGAGYEAPEACLLLEKLVSRRDRMIQDLGLSGEIPLLRPQGVNRHLSYDPATDGPFEVVLPSERKVAARNTGEYVLVNGVLKRSKDVKKGK